LVDENEFGVPAGWYPDPLGLPQLRWWDNRAWTEHTSEARAPIIIQPGSARLAYADQGLPSRREQRERERREREEQESAMQSELEAQGGDVEDELSAQPLLAMTLRELEPPASDTVDDDTPGPVAAATHANTSIPGRRSTFREEHVGLPSLREDRDEPRRSTKPTYTIAVWMIALIPVLQIVASVLLITVWGLGNNLPLLLVVWVSPYLIVLGFAAYDRLALKTAGHEKPASPLWALLTAPAYLLARARRTIKETGKGFAPLVIWSGASFALVASVLVLPGILISLMPTVFSNEAEQSVAATAATLGAQLTLDCPAAPPLMVGELYTCRATKPNGDSDSIAVSLQRANGWITWQVEDWGLWVLTD
jgi:hypothetical protein